MIMQEISIPQAKLLESAREMNEEALVKIFDTYATALFRYALRLCHNAVIADQIVGDVFGKLLDQLEAGQGPTENLRAYLFESAYHLVIDDSRYNHKFVSEEFIDNPKVSHNTKSVEQMVEEKIMESNMHEALQRLSGEQRHVLILRYFENFSLQETADIMGKNVNAIKSLQHRAVKSLGHEMGIRD